MSRFVSPQSWSVWHVARAQDFGAEQRPQKAVGRGETAASTEGRTIQDVGPDSISTRG